MIFFEMNALGLCSGSTLQLQCILGEYPLKPQNKMEYIRFFVVLLCWTISGTAGML